MSKKSSNKHSVKVVQTKQVSYSSGPIPSPEILGKYEQITEGLANRIITMAEKQSLHRQLLEKKAVESDIGIRSKGQIFAFILGVMAIVAATILILNGKNLQGFIVLIGSLGALVTAFMYGSQVRSKERKDKTKILQGHGIPK